jgi:hypothetical protein
MNIESVTGISATGGASSAGCWTLDAQLGPRRPAADCRATTPGACPRTAAITRSQPCPSTRGLRRSSPAVDAELFTRSVVTVAEGAGRRLLEHPDR